MIIRDVCVKAILLLALSGAIPLMGEEMSRQVIKISVTKQEYDFFSPWKKRVPQKMTVSGCIVAGNMILTNSYSIADHVLIEVYKNGDSRRYEAEALVKDYNSGLALIRAKNSSFYSGLEQAAVSEPKGIIGEKTGIYRWDTDGNFREFTAEVINTSIRLYKPNCAAVMHTMSTGMDAGGYGEPVFINKKLIGIATGFDAEKKNIMVIGVDGIRRMLDDMADGVYEGAPFFWIDGIPLESDLNLRTYLGLEEKDSGVYVNGIHPASSGAGDLRPGDIIMGINGLPVDDNGLYLSPVYGKLNYHGIIHLNNRVNDTVHMNLKRDGKNATAAFRLKPVPLKEIAVQIISFDSRPEYLITGGLLFQYLSHGYMRTWGAEWEKISDRRMLHYYNRYSMKPASEKKIVILNRVLPASINSGYQNKGNLILSSVNGVQVKDLNDVRKIILASGERYLKFDFAGNTSIVLNRKEAAVSEPDILRKYSIPAAYHLDE